MKRLIHILLLTLVLGACDGGPSTPAAGGHTPPPPRVLSARVEQGPLAQRLERNGTLRAARSAVLRSREAGDLITLPRREGERVEQGELLFAIDDALLRAQLKRAEAERAQAELDLKRVRRLQGQSLVAEEELARARTALEVARAEEQLLRTRIDQSRVTAPFSGVIAQRSAEPGDVLGAHSEVLRLIDDSRLLTEVRVSELLLPQLALGDTVELRIDALGGTPLEARIERIHPEVDPATRQGTVEIAIDAPPEGARPGQLCRVTLNGRALPRLTVPFAALRRDAEGEYVFTIADDTARRHAVRSGLHFGDRVELLEGPAAGTAVVVSGFFGLSDGSAVRGHE